MSLQARKEMLASIQEKYQNVDWTVKNQLLDGFIAATGYERKHAIKLLNGKVLKPVEEHKKRGKRSYYDESVVQVLELIWHASNQICSKRIVPFIPELVASLEKHGHLRLSDEMKKQVLSVSPATFGRLLRHERIKINNGLSTTSPGSVLKNQIKVRTFADWNEEEPGFFEADLVAHCGEATRGVFLNTLVMTDIVTTWTECIALIRKNTDDVILGLDTASQLLPFKILGFDVDNGCEFINYDVMDYCETNNITFTRSRAYKKNDQAHVEEKNGSIVRRLVGYDRYETEAAWEALCSLYAVLRLYINFFQPSLKLLEKIRKGSKTIKKYDKAKTPYQRVLLSSHIGQDVKNKLTQQYNNLDPIALKEQIKNLQNQLWQHAWGAEIMPAVDELQIANTGQEVEEVNPRLYRKTKKAPHRRDYRTRKDPFEHVREFIKFELEIDPTVNIKDILDKLMKKYPDDFCKGHLRTLQRRISEIRAELHNREEKYQELMISKKTPLSAEIEDNYDIESEHIQNPNYQQELALQKLKRSLWITHFKG